MAIDFATFLNVAPHILNSKLPVLIRGRHGVGKSEVVYQIAATRDLPVVERRASQMTEGDLSACLTLLRLLSMAARLPLGTLPTGL